MKVMTMNPRETAFVDVTLM